MRENERLLGERMTLYGRNRVLNFFEVRKGRPEKKILE